MLLRLICGVLCLALLGAAAPMPGAASAGGAFKVNGIDVPATAAGSIPVTIGDQFTAGETEVIIRLDEFGAVFTVEPHSKVATGQLDGKPFLRLLAGRVRYTLSDLSKVLLFKQNQGVTPAFAGAISIGSHKKPAAIAIGAGAAAVATTVALVNRSPSCPSGQTCK